MREAQDRATSLRLSAGAKVLLREKPALHGLDEVRLQFIGRVRDGEAARHGRNFGAVDVAFASNHRREELAQVLKSGFHGGHYTIFRRWRDESIFGCASSADEIWYNTRHEKTNSEFYVMSVVALTASILTINRLCDASDRVRDIIGYDAKICWGT